MRCSALKPSSSPDASSEQGPLATAALAIVGSSKRFSFPLVVSALEREAAHLAHRLALHRAAPTPAEARDSLRRLIHLADALAAGLTGLDAVTVGLLADLGHGSAAPAAASAANTLRRAIDDALAELRARAPASPGPANLAGRLLGDPRRDLCLACARIVAAFAGRHACTGTVGGLLYRVAAAVWLHATGDDPEEASLDRFVKAAAVEMRAGQNLVSQPQVSGLT